MKICKKCGSTEFYESGGCKPCVKARSNKRRLEKPEAIAKWNEDNKELRKELKRIWIENNKDHVVEYAKNYHIERYSTDEEFRNKAIIRAATWRKDNPDQDKSRHKEWQKDNEERLKEYRR